MFDGQNLFGDRGSFAGGWHVHEAAAQFARVRRTIAPIVVALDHGHSARIAELTPFSDGARGGRLEALLGTITDELLPRVHARFPILQGPTAHFLGGASLGGLAAVYGHLVRPDTFGGALAMSPSLWFTRDRLAGFLHGLPRPTHSRIYLDVGGREGTGMRPSITSFARGLHARGWLAPDARSDLRVQLRVDARGRHHERAWRRRFPAALRFLFAR
jgi:predicted alpha/beta superfamily hydrolase